MLVACRAFKTVNTGKIRERFDNGDYLQFNYLAAGSNHASQKLQGLLQSFRGQQLPAAAGIVLSEHNLLVLFGTAGTSTGFHVDWTQAKNVALALHPKVRP